MWLDLPEGRWSLIPSIAINEHLDPARSIPHRKAVVDNPGFLSFPEKWDIPSVGYPLVICYIAVLKWPIDN